VFRYKWRVTIGQRIFQYSTMFSFVNSLNISREQLQRILSSDHRPSYAVITIAIRLRSDYDVSRAPAFIRRDQKWTCHFFVVVESQLWYKLNTVTFETKCVAGTSVPASTLWRSIVVQRYIHVRTKTHDGPKSKLLRLLQIPTDFQNSSAGTTEVSK